MEVGGRGRLYTYRYTVTTRMTSVLRWAVMRAIFNVLLIVRDKVTRLSTDCNFSRERRAEVDSNRCPSAYQPNALPLGHTGSRLALFFSVRSVLLYVHRDRTDYN